MPGIYLHIPYCRKACHYCDFHFSTNLKNKTAMVDAIVQELHIRKDYFQREEIKTIYFGGGTPSLLEENELQKILETIHQLFSVNSSAEITMECNPEDLSTEKLEFLKQAGINRLSIGIQTFNNEILQFLNRAHDADEAINAVKNAKILGFENITIDLMYALPNSTLKTLQHDLELATSLDVPHISAYCFTLEEKTVFGKWEKKKIILKNSDETEQAHYHLLTSHLKTNGYEQYEISNFARNERYSKHNSAYWMGELYLGIGPGSHSFDGTNRAWNISNNAIYIEKLNAGLLALETEILSNKDRINEAILIQLRTKWGLDLSKIKEELGYDLFAEKKAIIEKLSTNRLIEIKDSKMYLTEEGKLLADGIVVELML